MLVQMEDPWLRGATDSERAAMDLPTVRHAHYGPDHVLGDPCETCDIGGRVRINPDGSQWPNRQQALAAVDRAARRP